MRQDSFDKPLLTSAAGLDPEQLRRHVDPYQLPASTAEVSPLEGTIGQPRALDAIAFGLEINSPGYHLFIAGPPGSGRERTIQDFLQRLPPVGPRRVSRSTSMARCRQSAESRLRSKVSFPSVSPGG